MRFVIFAPPYRGNSGGIRCLYEFQKALVRQGFDAITTQIPIDYDEDDILIVPEVIPLEWCTHDKIVRWYMYWPLKAINYKDSEVPIACHEEYKPGAHVVNFNNVESFFSDYGFPERTYTAYYVGKGQKTDTELPKGCMEITLDWPPTRRNMADLLNRCSDVYIYDDCCMLAQEALNCGCKVWLVGDEIKPYPIPDIPHDADSQIPGFIDYIKEKFYGEASKNG